MSPALATLAVTAGIVPDRKGVTIAIEPRVVGLEVAAGMYGISADQITELQRVDGFPFVLIGRRSLVPVAQADAWFAARVRHEWVA